MNYKLESNILKIQSDDNQFTDEMLKFLEKQNILEGFDEIRIVKDGSEKTFSVVMSKELLALIKKVTEGKARLIYDKVQL